MEYCLKRKKKLIHSPALILQQLTQTFTDFLVILNLTIFVNRLNIDRKEKATSYTCYYIVKQSQLITMLHSIIDS